MTDYALRAAVLGEDNEKVTVSKGATFGGFLGQRPKWVKAAPLSLWAVLIPQCENYDNERSQLIFCTNF